MPEPVVTNAYTLINGSYTYSNVITVNELKELISEEKLSDEIWKNDMISGYPVIKWATEDALINYIESLSGYLVTSKTGGNMYVTTYSENGSLAGVQIYNLEKPAIYKFNPLDKVFIWNNNLMPLTDMFIVEGK